MKRTKTIYSQDYCVFIQALSDERKRLGLSQLEVANLVGMTQSEISKIESTERRLDIFELKQLLRVYRIDQNYKLQQLVIDFFGLQSSEHERTE